MRTDKKPDGIDYGIDWIAVILAITTVFAIAASLGQCRFEFRSTSTQTRLGVEIGRFDGGQP